jgi:ADP-L-glycero-D-manno-heptose 6-epimerase
MIVITGAYGFIGSCLLSQLNIDGFTDIVIVDDFSKDAKAKNLDGKKYLHKVEREDFIDWFTLRVSEVTAVYHLGARTDTTAQDTAIFDTLNVHYSQSIWRICADHSIPLVYASSAATYGDGSLGFDDDHALIPSLQPLNPYGWSKQQFDIWALAQTHCPPKWVGLKFFNVYGPNEYHKSRMASVIFHSYNKILATAEMQLFKSHKDGIQDGHQSRDFIYVKDIIAICNFCMNTNVRSGIYNAGTGQARTFLDLTKATFDAMNVTQNISFIDTPIDIRDTYQYFTEANMSKLKDQGFEHNFISLEDGVKEYVRDYLVSTSTF